MDASSSFSSLKSPRSHHHDDDDDDDDDDDRRSSPLSLPSPTNDNDDSVPLDTKTTSRILNFSPEKFSLLKLFHCDHSIPQSSRPRRQDPDYEYATEDDDDDDDNEKDVNNEYDYGDGDTVDDHEEDDDEMIVVEKIITSRKDTIDHWNQICKTLNTSEIMNGSLWQDQSQLNGSTSKQQQQQQQQHCSSEMIQERFLVKWKDLSYIHCTWETRDVLIDLTTNGVHQLNSFLKRNSHDEKVGDELYDDGMKEDHYGIKSFMMIDRILDVKSFGNNMTTCDIVLDKNDPRYEEGMGRTFLIKWCGLPYSESTYEHERDLILMKVEYESHHDAFVRRHTKPNTRQVKDNMAKHDRLVHHLRRLFRTRAQVHDVNVNDSSSSGSSSSSNMKGYVKELQGQIYRNKGTLREYQAEGVAWMIANYVNGRSSILADVSTVLLFGKYVRPTDDEDEKMVEMYLYLHCDFSVRTIL
jgi:''chromo'' (CHRromatin Organisation MOdifier) domain.